MWLLFGIGAIFTTMINLLWWFKSKESATYRFISISLVALTVCDFYRITAKWVVAEDWSALMDVAPTISVVLWITVIVLIMVNGLTLFKKK